jgi:diadenosine tetraphosphate (Ap4A) HIT family hydrolase
VIEENFQPAGYNIGFNVGAAAGQTVMHCHCHVIPRYIGHVKEPRSGGFWGHAFIQRFVRLCHE